MISLLLMETLHYPWSDLVTENFLGNTLACEYYELPEQALVEDVVFEVLMDLVGVKALVLPAAVDPRELVFSRRVFAEMGECLFVSYEGREQLVMGRPSWSMGPGKRMGALEFHEGITALYTALWRLRGGADAAEARERSDPWTERERLGRSGIN